MTVPFGSTLISPHVPAGVAFEKARKVVKISVWLGALSQMSPEHFGHHFEDAAAGSLAEGAELECVASDDIHDPRAQDVVLQGIEVET